MELDSGITSETLLSELTLLMARVTRIVGDPSSEISFLTETVEVGKEVITPTHETETGKVTEASLAPLKARGEATLKTTQPFIRDPSKPTTLVFENKTIDRILISLPMNKSSQKIMIKHHPMKSALPQQMIVSMN